MFHDILHWKSLECMCLSLQYVERHVYVNLMERRCSGVTVDPIVHEIHHVYISLVKMRLCGGGRTSPCPSLSCRFYFLFLSDHGFHCGTLKLLEGH